MNEEKQAKVYEKNGVIIFSMPVYLSTESGEELKNLAQNQFQNGKKNFVFDFKDCNIVNSQGVTALLDVAMKTIDDYSGKILFANLDDSKIDFFSLVGLIPLVSHFSTLEEAIQQAI